MKNAAMLYLGRWLAVYRSRFPPDLCRLEAAELEATMEGCDGGAVPLSIHQREERHEEALQRQILWSRVTRISCCHYE